MIRKAELKIDGLAGAERIRARQNVECAQRVRVGQLSMRVPLEARIRRLKWTTAIGRRDAVELDDLLGSVFDSEDTVVQVPPIKRKFHVGRRVREGCRRAKQAQGEKNPSDEKANL
jgi:hypothetical protein